VTAAERAEARAILRAAERPRVLDNQGAPVPPAEIARGVHLACGAIVNACALVWHRYGTASALGKQCDRLLSRTNCAARVADEIAPENRRDPPPPDPEGYIPRNAPRARPHPHRMTKAEHDRLGLDLARARLRLLRAQVQLGKSDARGLVTLLLAGLDRLRCALDDAECREHGTIDCYYGREPAARP